MIDYYKFLKIDELRDCISKEECRDKCIRFFNNVYSYHYHLESLKLRKDNSEYHRLYNEFLKDVKDSELKDECYFPIFLCTYVISYRFVIWFMYKTRFNSNISKCDNIINDCITGFNFKKSKLYDSLFHNLSEVDLSLYNINSFGNSAFTILFLLNYFVLHTKRSRTREYDYEQLCSTDVMGDLLEIKSLSFLMESVNKESFNKSVIEFDFGTDNTNESLDKNIQLRRIFESEGGDINELDI